MRDRDREILIGWVELRQPPFLGRFFAVLVGLGSKEIVPNLAA